MLGTGQVLRFYHIHAGFLKNPVVDAQHLLCRVIFPSKVKFAHIGQVFVSP